MKNSASTGAIYQLIHSMYRVQISLPWMVLRVLFATSTRYWQASKELLIVLINIRKS